MIHFICNKDVVHNTVHYRKGQAWDGDLPAPRVGADWAILQYNEPDDPQRGGVGASASKGFVRWKEQPARQRAASLTPEEKERLRINPYDQLDDSPPLPPVVSDPPASEKPQPILSVPSEKSLDEKIKEARAIHARQHKTKIKKH